MTHEKFWWVRYKSSKMNHFSWFWWISLSIYRLHKPLPFCQQTRHFNTYYCTCLHHSPFTLTLDYSWSSTICLQHCNMGTLTLTLCPVVYLGLLWRGLPVWQWLCAEWWPVCAGFWVWQQAWGTVSPCWPIPHWQNLNNFVYGLSSNLWLTCPCILHNASNTPVI